MDSQFPVVISGISGRFPNCDDVVEFQEKLYSRKSFMSLKKERWPINYRYKYTDDVIPAATGKLKHVKDFDVATFKINYATAECTDVINRQVLEPSFEAIMDAGINPYELDGRNIAVYMASAHCDSDATAACLGEGRLWVLGSSKTMMSNRVSFALNLQGPSYTLSNDMFGTLTALDEAYKNVAKGYVEAAIVGVTSAVQHPNLALHLTKMNYLSMDAMTRVFDKAANGYGRSDSVVAFYIQRYEDAKRAYASIDFSGYTYYGSNPNSFLAYEEDLLKSSLLDLYKQSNYNNIDDISFMEMSACGLKRCDRIEANTIADIVCKNRHSPLLVGSVKSNIGNAEVAAPFVGLIKAILALESGTIASNISLENINDEIRAFAENNLKVVTKPTTLSGCKVAVNSVGITGSLSQVILRRNSKNPVRGGSVKDNLPRLVLICGRTEDGTRLAMQKLERIPFNTDFISLLNDVFSTDMPFHIYRGYAIHSSNIKDTKKNAMDVKGNRNRPVWFLFSGMGSQWNGMGKDLLDIPIFAETVRKCYNVLKPKGLDIYHILTTDDATIFDNIVHAFVGIITIQIALIEILKALGIKPDGIIGHSVGENACAYADGCLTLEQAVLASYARGVASMETETIKGMMAAVGKGYKQIKDCLPNNIEVACHNSATSSTLSGPAEDVEKFVEKLQQQKVFARAVNVANIAYHSKYIAPAAPNLLARLREVIPTPIERSSKWVSTSIAEKNWNKPLAMYCSAEYLTNNLLNQVLFEEGSKHIPSDALVIEIAPHGLLQAIIKRSLPETCANVALTRRNNDGKNIENLLTAIGELYIAGCNVNINALYPPIEYPVPRETPSIAPFSVWYRTAPDAGVYHFDLVGSHSSDPVTVRVNEDSPYYYLQYHQIHKQIILPTALYLYLTWWVFSVDRNIQLGSLPIVFEDIKLFKNINTSIHKPRSFTFFIQRGTGKFEILKCSKSDQYKTTLVMTGIIYQPTTAPNHNINQNQLYNTTHTVTSDQFYNVFANVGYQLSDTFRSLEELTYNETDCYGKIKWNDNWVSLLDSLLKFSMFSEMKNETDLLYTQKIRKLEISATSISSLTKGMTLLCHKESKTNMITCDGLMMVGIENNNITSQRPNTNIKLEGLRFVSHKNPRCQNIREFIKICLEIAIDNVSIMAKKTNNKLNIIESTDKMFNYVRQIIKDSDELKLKIMFYQPKHILSKKLSGDGNCVLLITDNIFRIQKYEIESLFVLLSVPRNEPIPVDISKTFTEITKQSFAENTLYLFKKNPITTNGHLPYVFAEDIDLTSKHSSVSNKHKSTFIVKKNIEAEDLNLMFSQKKASDPRYLFLVDQEIPNESIMKTQIIQDLPVAVYKDAEWGSYRPVSETQPEATNKRKHIYDLPADIQLKSIQIQYLSSDDGAAYDGNKKKKFGIEYSGLHDSGARIMGLSSVSPFEPITEPDINFMWTIPKAWSLEDAATVPFIYAQAFNILSIIRGQIFTNTILINVGEEGLLAEACISISLDRKYNVYVTVSSNQEASIIKKKFPRIPDSQILYQQSCQYEIQLLKITEGLGVDMVINYLPGMEHINASLNCTGQFGHCVQMGDTNAAEIHSLGLRSFLRSISFIVVPNKISHLSNLSTNDKVILKKLVDEGMKIGLVVPFERNVQIEGMPEAIDQSPEQTYIKTIYKCFPQNEMSLMANQKIRFDNTHSYIIVGGEKKDSSWFELVEWLINKGARKFIIAIDNFNISTKISHQMNRVLNKKKVTIILNSAQKVATVQNAVQFIEEANKIAPLEAVFFTSVESAAKKIHNIDLATQKTEHYNVHLISLFSGGLKECESRRCKGSPALVIQAGEKSSLKLSTVLPLIDDLLLQFDNSNSPTLYRIKNTNVTEHKIDNSNIRNYIPHDIPTLEFIGRDLSQDSEFVEVTTLSPRFSDVKEITPIFVISALGPKPLQGLFSKLMYPTFCATITRSYSSAVEVATKLYQSLNRIQCKQGVTLIAETWWSSVAFELTHLLERDDRKYQLFLLEGNPLAWKEIIKTLGPVDSVQFENNLITQVLNIDHKTSLENQFTSSHSLLDKISTYLGTRQYLPSSIQQLIKVITTIRNGLVLASKYDYTNEIIKHTISLAGRLTKHETTNFSITSELFVHEEEDYYKFLNSVKTSRKINDNVVHNMWYTKE